MYLNRKDGKMLTNEKRIEALQIIERVQRKTSSIVVEIGGTTEKGQVEDDTLYLLEACAGVINALQAAGFTLDMYNKKLAVQYYGK